MGKIRVLAVVGPTASGKSELAMALAERLNGEIVCMDSMQVYRRMDIGTAKPTAQERSRVRHHLLDVVEPTEAFAVADYAGLAAKAIEDIASRGRLPVLAGGTGLYLSALARGLTLGGVKGDEELRARYAAIAEEPGGRQRLHDLLAQADPVTAARLHPNDLRRVVRALEVCELTGKPMSAQRGAETPGPYAVLALGLRMPRELLFQRVERRVRRMMELGLLDEVRSLLKSGVPPTAQSMQGIGYKELVPAALGGGQTSDAVRRIILNTRHYAKRQETWFRAEPAVRWLDAQSPGLLQAAEKAAAGFFSTAVKEAE